MHHLRIQVNKYYSKPYEVIKQNNHVPIIIFDTWILLLLPFNFLKLFYVFCLKIYNVLYFKCKDDFK